MDIFRKTTRTAGWMAAHFQGNSICVAHIQRSTTTLPQVTLAASYTCINHAEATTLTKLAKERHANRYQCTTLLSSSEYKMLSVEAPNVPEAELKTAIRWRIKDTLDYPVDDATLDILNIPQDKNIAAKNQAIYVAAAPSKSIEQCQFLFGQAKISLSAIDIPEMAQCNIATLLKSENRGVALLSFNAEGGLLTITYSGALYLSRRIDVTLSQLEQFNTEQKNILYDKITLELQRSLDHFDRQYNFITLSKLVLAPLGDAGIGLQEYMAKNLYVPVEILNLETILDLSKVPELKQPQQQQRYFMVLGAALRDDAQASINLYNPLLVKQKNNFQAHTMVQALGLIFIGTLILYGYTWHHSYEMKKQAGQGEKLLETMQEQLAQISPTPESKIPSKLLEDEVAKSEAQIKARHQILDLMKTGVLGNTQGFSEYFRAFSRQTMDGLWITRFQASGTDNVITISGRALQPTQVPTFIHNLKKEKVMTGKTFETLEMRTPAANVTTDGNPAASPPYIEFSLLNSISEKSR